MTNIVVSVAASSSANSRSTLGLIPSSPPVLCGFRFFKSFFTPSQVMMMLSMAGIFGSVIPVLRSNSSAVYSATHDHPQRLTEIVHSATLPVPWGQR